MRRYAWAGVYSAAALIVTLALAFFFPKYSRFLILFFVLVLADGRLWLSFRKQILHSSKKIMILAGLLFMSPAILLGIALIAGIFIPFSSWNIPVRTHFINVILILYTVKVFPVVSLLLSDLFRLVAFLFRKIYPEIPYNFRMGCRTCITAGWVIGIISGVVLFYGTLSGLFNFKVNRIEVAIPGLPPEFNNFKIVQISDIHLGSWTSGKQLNVAVDSILDLDPDMVVFTGDMFNYMTAEGNDFIPILKRIKAPYGVFAILGNHDYGDYIAWPNEASKKANMVQLYQFYRQIGWDLLLNSHRIIKKGNDSIVIAGVENWGASPRFQRFGDVEKALEGVKNCTIQILLSHDPSHWDSIVSNNYPSVDLVLSGHTHGGQIGIMNGGFRFSPSKWIYPHWSGLYKQKTKENTQYLYVNQGLGTIGYAGRLNMPPEITLLVLRQ